MQLLLEGRPGIGKTTVARRVVDRLRAAGCPVAGFTTEELREGGERAGFRIESVRGPAGILAHVDLPGPPSVGRYGVDLETLERIALPAISGNAPVTVIDELGKMELASEELCRAVDRLFRGDRDVVATVHLARHPLTDELRGRFSVKLIRVDARNRDELPELIATRLLG